MEAWSAARTLGLQFHVLHASSERELDAAFATLVQLRAGALVIGADLLFNSRGEQLATLTIRHRVPAIYQFREFVSAGGLMAYGSTVLDTYRPPRHLHGPNSQRREARRDADPAGDQSRARHQHEDRQGAWPHRPAACLAASMR
jgi:hypothetical protein